jgi:hypothetical protein
MLNGLWRVRRLTPPFDLLFFQIESLVSKSERILEDVKGLILVIDPFGSLLSVGLIVCIKMLTTPLCHQRFILTFFFTPSPLLPRRAK